MLTVRDFSQQWLVMLGTRPQGLIRTPLWAPLAMGPCPKGWEWEWEGGGRKVDGKERKHLCSHAAGEAGWVLGGRNHIHTFPRVLLAWGLVFCGQSSWVKPGLSAHCSCPNSERKWGAQLKVLATWLGSPISSAFRMMIWASPNPQLMLYGFA